MRRFHKRTFSGPRQFFGEAFFLLRHVAALLGILRGKRLDARFRERLFIAVTQVNECRFCTWAHTRIALREGLSENEVSALFQADLASTPEGERDAVLYAQHWADSGGYPEPVLRSSIERRCGSAHLQDIDLALRFIRFWNYFGNLAELAIYLVSFGHVGARTGANSHAESSTSASSEP